MKILLVNDDGINSGLLRFTRDILLGFGEVYTVAPLIQQSGKSVAISIRPFNVNRLDDFTYSVDGTPVDCINFALFGLEIIPDLVISGINKGFNLGVDTMYSGTVGAALQANYHGYKAIAFSGDYKGSIHAKTYFKKVLTYIIDNNLSSRKHILNVNFPPDSIKEIDGNIKFSKVYFLKMKLIGNYQDDELSKFSHVRAKLEGNIPHDSDIFVTHNGSISISKIRLRDEEGI